MNSFFKDLINLEFMPCHRKKERSLIIFGKQFPICVRCMFILIGYFFIIPLMLLPEYLSFKTGILFGLLFVIPMLLDGFTQQKGLRKSNNFLRGITGLISGIGMSILIVTIARGLIDVIFLLL